MGYDIGEWTARVLDDGLPPLPERLEPSQTVPLALWRGEQYGAVLFVRLWRNGNIDCDCAIAERAADRGWDEADAWGGGGWIDDPLKRSEGGWDGSHVVWLWLSGRGGGDGDLEVRTVAGAASAQVAAIETTHAGRTWTVPIDSPAGAFIVGVEGHGPATLRALGRDGRALGDTTL